jgi:predicted transcriptional regulator
MFSLKQERAFMTTRSKLEFYEDVLKALSHNQQTLDAIAFDGNMDCMLLRQKMDFLVENGLVEELQCNRKTLYGLTSRGEAVLKTLTLTKRIAKLQAEIAAAAIEKEPVHAVQGEVWKTKRKM